MSHSTKEVEIIFLPLQRTHTSYPSEASVTTPDPHCASYVPFSMPSASFVKGGVNAAIISDSKPTLQSLSAVQPTHQQVVQQIVLSIFNECP